jgi:hypothetical protein
MSNTEKPVYPCATKERKVRLEAEKITSIAEGEIKIVNLLNRLMASEKPLWTEKYETMRGLRECRQLLGDLQVHVSMNG